MKNKLIKKATLFAVMLMTAFTVSVTNSSEAKASYTIEQTAQTSTSATISWTPVPNASLYEVYLNGTKCGTTKETTYTVNVLNPGTKGYVSVYVYDNNSKPLGSFSSLRIATKPSITDVILHDWSDPTSPVFTVKENNTNKPDGIEIELYNDKKKQIKVDDLSHYTLNYLYVNAGKSIKNASFLMRVRPYYIGNKQKIYGDWTALKAYVAQPRLTGKSLRNCNTRTIKLKWSKVKGAKSYSVYRATKQKGKYKKVCTTKKTSFSQNVKFNSTYYYYVKANKVVGGKKTSTTLGEHYRVLYCW